ncbi:DUF4010 domain-containing protein [Cupriavidus lacunae]|uniref:DUF4010 domain-containing protein n=1 Tax=Cupriavidus lacunae TaxID=2666307 RepID=UPI001FC97FD6|nr:DUF4010 domain-containing protein [Cupriavidus lacunae]
MDSLAGAAGHIFARLFGDRLGLPVSGLFGGFVSSTATIAAMAVLSRRSAELSKIVASAAGGVRLCRWRSGWSCRPARPGRWRGCSGWLEASRQVGYHRPGAVRIPWRARSDDDDDAPCTRNRHRPAVLFAVGMRLPARLRGRRIRCHAGLQGRRSDR